MTSIFTLLGISILIQIMMFIPAFLLKTDKLTDFSYGLSFIILSIVAFISSTAKQAGSSASTAGKAILLAMIILWALRLGIYLVVRIRKIKKDNRFDGIRESFFKFLQFWILQGISVWVILIPSLLYFNSQAYLGILSLAGFIVWASGLCIEAVADMQKYRFSNNPKNKGKWIDSGLWRYSRHPNYFGEILCWIGIFIFTLNSLAAVQRLIALIGPVFISSLLIFVTGIPKLEKSADNKWGKDKAYIEYKRNTSVLVMLPRKKH